jgi:hypothetical protein
MTGHHAALTATPGPAADATRSPRASLAIPAPGFHAGAWQPVAVAEQRQTELSRRTAPSFAASRLREINNQIINNKNLERLLLPE